MVARTGAAVAIPIEAGARLATAAFEFAAEDIRGISHALILHRQSRFCRVLIYAIRQLKDAQTWISGHFGSIRLPAAASALCWDAVATTWNDPAMRILSIWITFLAFGVVASGGAGPLVVMTEADSGHRIALRIGQELFLNLKSNPSTGYSWIRADTETSVLVMLGKPA